MRRISDAFVTPCDGVTRRRKKLSDLKRRQDEEFNNEFCQPTVSSGSMLAIFKRPETKTNLNVSQ